MGMLMEWLEPKIVDHMEKVSMDIQEDAKVKKVLDEFMTIFGKLTAAAPEYKSDLLDMESAMNMMVLLCEEHSYRRGLLDGMAIHQDIRTILGG